MKTGDTVGGHRVIELAGSGGMGTVYKAEHLITRRIEAIKVLPLRIGVGTEEILRFEREIQVQARLQHPNIAALYSASRADNAMHLVMEYVEGESLGRILARGRLSIAEAAAYAGHILDALAYAHGQGVVHCDVSPANVIVTTEGVAKLTDFGLARAVSDIGGKNVGVAAGSPWHMAPEQVRGTEPLDERTDLYAMGTVLYEMLTGRKLFDVEGAFAILRAHLDVVPARPRVYRRDIPPSLDAVVVKALSKQPGARYQTAGEFLVALDSAMKSRRRAAPRLAWIAAGVLAITVAAAAVTRFPRPTADTPAAIPPPEAPTPKIPPAPLEVSTPPAAVEEKLPSVQTPLRPAFRHAPPANPPAPVEPRASLRPPAADATLPDAPHVDPIVRDTPLPIPLEAQAPAIDPPKAAPKGNRFVRAIGKLNPFRKDSKDETTSKR